METTDEFQPERDFARYLADHAKFRQWDELMQTFQEKVPEAGADEWWTLMEPVYELG